MSTAASRPLTGPLAVLGRQVLDRVQLLGQWWLLWFRTNQLVCRGNINGRQLEIGRAHV